MRTRTTSALAFAMLALLACRTSPPPMSAAAEPVTRAWGAEAPDDRAAAGNDGAPLLAPLTPRPSADEPTRRAPLSGPFGYTFEELRSGRIDHIIHGAGPLWSLEEHDAYRRALAETPPYMVRMGINLAPQRRRTFDQQLEIIRDQFARYADQIPMLTISFNEKFDDGTARGLDGEVVEGRFDRKIVRLAGAVAGAGRPVFVRIGPECNGIWNGYSHEHFADAFRRIVRLFRERGADQAIYVWNYKATLHEPVPYMSYYPGDDVVDWWSIDLFGEDIRSKRLRRRVQVYLADAAARNKPVIIPESAPSKMDLSDVRTWDRWFVPYFALINRDPNIKGFCYSNRDFATQDVNLASWGNMRIDQSPLWSRYQAELMGPQYLHQRRPFDPEAAPSGTAPER